MSPLAIPQTYLRLNYYIFITKKPVCFFDKLERSIKINNQIIISDTIINTINIIFNNLFSSINNNIYSVLDKLIFINTDIINNSIINKLLGSNLTSSLLAITNSLLIGFSIYYGFKLLFSHFTFVEIETPYQFIFKLLIITICINFSYFICEQIININYLISGSIQQLGQNIINSNISFNKLILDLNSIISTSGENFNIFSVDGIIKGLITFSLLNLVFSYTIRYVLIKIFIMISPFAILSLLNRSTSWLFKSWLRYFIGLLLIQSVIALILLIIFSINYNSTDLFSKLLFVGGIYLLTQVNSYIKRLIGGITTDFNSAISSIRGFIK